MLLKMVFITTIDTAGTHDRTTHDRSTHDGGSGWIREKKKKFKF